MERLHLPRAVVKFGLIGALVLGVPACGSDGQAKPETKPPVPSERVSNGGDKSAPEIITKYYSNGTSTVEVKADFPTSTGTLVVRWCEGGDLVELASVDQSFEAGGGSETRSANHAACDDNRLTAKDFADLPG